MSHIAISQPAIKAREKGTLLTRVLNRCMRLLPFLRTPGYFPMPPWGIVDPRAEEAQTPPIVKDQPRDHS